MCNGYPWSTSCHRADSPDSSGILSAESDFLCQQSLLESPEIRCSTLVPYGWDHNSGTGITRIGTYDGSLVNYNSIVIFRMSPCYIVPIEASVFLSRTDKSIIIVNGLEIGWCANPVVGQALGSYGDVDTSVGRFVLAAIFTLVSRCLRGIIIYGDAVRELTNAPGSQSLIYTIGITVLLSAEFQQ